MAWINPILKQWRELRFLISAGWELRHSMFQLPRGGWAETWALQRGEERRHPPQNACFVAFKRQMLECVQPATDKPYSVWRFKSSSSASSVSAPPISSTPPPESGLPSTPSVPPSMPSASEPAECTPAASATEHATVVVTPTPLSHPPKCPAAPATSTSVSTASTSKSSVRRAKPKGMRPNRTRRRPTTIR